MYYWSVIDEQSGQCGCFRQVSATIVTQVDNQPVNALVFQFADQTLNVLGRTGVILVAGAQCAVIPIKARYLDDTDLPVTTVPGYRYNLALGCLLLELHLVAGKAKNFLFAARQFSGWHDLQSYNGVGFATYELHDIIESPADHVDQLAIFTLCDGCDLVLGLQHAVDRGRTTGDDVDDHHVVILDLQ